MEETTVFQYFETGCLCLPERTIGFESLKWVKHPVFEGVELKHLLTGEDSGGAFSYHLVRIAAAQKIGMHVHEAQLETHEVIGGSGTALNDGIHIDYEPGVMSVFPPGIAHEIVAGEKGLFLFAKFFPALC